MYLQLMSEGERVEVAVTEGDENKGVVYMESLATLDLTLSLSLSPQPASQPGQSS